MKASVIPFMLCLFFFTNCRKKGADLPAKKPAIRPHDSVASTQPDPIWDPKYPYTDTFKGRLTISRPYFGKDDIFFHNDSFVIFVRHPQKDMVIFVGATRFPLQYNGDTARLFDSFDLPCTYKNECVFTRGPYNYYTFKKSLTVDWLQVREELGTCDLVQCTGDFSGFCR